MANEQEIAKLIIRLTAESAELKKQLQEVSSTLTKHVGDTKGSLGDIKTIWLKTMAEIYAAYRLIMKAIDFVELGAHAQQVQASFKAMSQSMGIDGKALVENLKDIGYVFVEDVDLMAKSTRLMAEGFNPKQISQMMEASIVAAKKMGITVSQAFDLVTEAIVRGNVRGLRAAFPMDVAQVMNDYAAKIGRIGSQLNEHGRQQAIFNEVMKQSTETARQLGNAMAPDTSMKVQRLTSAIAALKEEVGKVSAESFGLMYDLIKKLGDSADYVRERFEALPEWIKKIFRTGLPALGGPLGIVAGGPGYLKGIPKEQEYPLEGQVTAGMQAAKALIEKQNADRETNAREIEKKVSEITSEARKAIAQTELEINKSKNDSLNSQEIMAATERLENTSALERRLRIKAIQDNLNFEMQAIGAEQTAEVKKLQDSGMWEGLAKVQEEVSKKYAEKRKGASAKSQAEIDKAILEQAKEDSKALQEALKLDVTAFLPGPGEWETKAKGILLEVQKSELDAAVSTKEGLLTQYEDFYSKDLIAVDDYYNRKKKIIQDIATAQIDQLNAQMKQATAEGDTVKAKQLESQITQRQIQQTKDLLALDNERVSATEKEYQRILSIQKIGRDAEDIRIDQLRKQLRIDEATALKGKLELQERSLAAAQDELRLTKENTDEQGSLTKEQRTRIAELNKDITQYYANTADLQHQLEVQTGSFFDGMGWGWKQFQDQAKTSYQEGIEAVKELTDGMKELFSTIFKDLSTGSKTLGADIKKLLTDLSNKMFTQLFESGFTQLIKGAFGSKGSDILGLLGIGGKGTDSIRKMADTKLSQLYTIPLPVTGLGGVPGGMPGPTGTTPGGEITNPEGVWEGGLPANYGEDIAKTVSEFDMGSKITVTDLDEFGNVITGCKDGLDEFGNSITESVSTLSNFINQLLKGGGGGLGIGDEYDWANLPGGYQTGAVFNKPTLFKGIVGESGPEILMPEKKMLALMTSFFGPSKSVYAAGNLGPRSAEGGGGKLGKLDVNLTLDPSLIAEARTTPEQADMMVAMKYNQRGSLWRAVNRK